MLLYSEGRHDDGDSDAGIALGGFGQGVLIGEEDFAPAAAVSKADAQRHCGSEPQPGGDTAPAGPDRPSLKQRALAFSRAGLLAASAVVLTFWMAHTPSALPGLQVGATEAPSDLITLALDSVPVVADW
ncbi:MAG: hypothetical protein JOZ42_15515 [Acetobacteraceae bacterium]|nr:hypothetical protein [Acetobacteraceae bacterium]